MSYKGKNHDNTALLEIVAEHFPDIMKQLEVGKSDVQIGKGDVYLTQLGEL